MTSIQCIYLDPSLACNRFNFHTGRTLVALGDLAQGVSCLRVSIAGKENWNSPRLYLAQALLALFTQQQAESEQQQTLQEALSLFTQLRPIILHQLQQVCIIVESSVNMPTFSRDF